MCPPVRAVFGALDRPRLAALGGMLALSLLAQLALGTRTFPFVNWHMYASLPHGDPTVYRYDAQLRSGRTVPLVPGRFLGPESADRLMEALRRQVEGVRRPGADPAARDEHEQAVAAVARLYDEAHPGDPVAAVLVSAQTIALRSGRSGAPRVLWRVRP